MPLCWKLGDLKLKKPAGDTLLVFAEKTSLRFVLNQAYDPLSKQKAPKVLADALTWINPALLEFGIVGLSLRSLIEFLKTALQNSYAAVRTSATKTLVTVKLFAGSSIKDFLEDLNAQLLNTINTEFDKVEEHRPTWRAWSHHRLDDLFPRVEADGLLKGTTILADAKSDSWKTKKEGLEALQSILDQGSNKRLKSSMGDIGQVLKARVTDTNKLKAVQNLALDIVARIATGMGKPFEKHSRLLVLPVATILSDQKAPIHAAAIQILTAIAAACEGLDSMVQGLHTALETSNPLQKGALMHWIADWFGEHELASSLDLSSWTPAIVCSLVTMAVLMSARDHLVMFWPWLGLKAMALALAWLQKLLGQARAKPGQSHGFLVVNFAQSWLGLVKSQAMPKPTLAEAGQSQNITSKGAQALLSTLITVLFRPNVQVTVTLHFCAQIGVKTSKKIGPAVAGRPFMGI
ncbi:hypothetical protein DFH06DRAFT_1407392 [Mycena polygramma]|nr:hypothetical protein DFH06DRAFT_1407392 [Mycena polygramma]